MNVKAGTRRYRGGSRWEGVVRRDGKVVWACGHAHLNRDETSLARGESARDCSKYVLRWAGAGVEARALFWDAEVERAPVRPARREALAFTFGAAAEVERTLYREAPEAPGRDESVPVEATGQAPEDSGTIRARGPVGSRTRRQGRER